MTDGPRRLNRSGGISQRLLDSASLDKPSHASRRLAANLASTASAFSSTRGVGASGSVKPLNPVRTLVTWISIGAAASVALGFAASTLLNPASAPRAAAPMLTVPSPAPRAAAGPSDISAEPAAAPAKSVLQLAPAPQVAKPTLEAQGGTGNRIEPWVPSPLAVAPTAATPTNGTGNGPTKPSVASFEEVREIEAARAAVSRGDAAGAIAQLNDYDSSHPNGTLKPESMALRIQVLSNSGKATEARTLANEFQGKYPQHPLVQQVTGGVAK